MLCTLKISLKIEEYVHMQYDLISYFIICGVMLMLSVCIIYICMNINVHSSNIFVILYAHFCAPMSTCLCAFVRKEKKNKKEVSN